MAIRTSFREMGGKASVRISWAAARTYSVVRSVVNGGRLVPMIR
jgi:hypothetical protein